MFNCLKCITRKNNDVEPSGDSGVPGLAGVIKLIGHGGFGRVYSVVGGGGDTLYAVKVAEPHNPRQLQRLGMEIQIHSFLRHDRIVRMLDWVKTSHGQFYICLEYCEMGSLYSYVEQLKQEKRYMDSRKIRDVFGQLVEGCQYLHEQCIIHRDLKPQNILLTESLDVKITDFGLAIVSPGRRAVWESVWGSPGYVPPEVLVEPRYTPAADVWALGCVLFWMYAGFVAFPERNLKSRNYHRKVRRLYTIRKTTIKFDAVELRKLLLLLLEEQPEDRPSCDTILSHDFLRQGFLVDKKVHKHDRAVAKRHAFRRAPFYLDYWVELFGR
ncbi:serine/threonine-protein kinase PLK2-like [Branchiostoma floridae x Branchiostoma belcheri]